MTRLPERNLDILRAIAVLSVLVAHLFENDHPDQASLTLGRMGVLLFFVHTSLVLMASLERIAEREGKRGWEWIRVFYWRRAARIYPLAWLTIVLCIMSGISDVAARTPAALLANVALVQNIVSLPSVIGPLWTLPVEMQMYLLLPLCYLAARKSLTAVLAGFAIAVVFGALVHWSPVPGLWRLTVGTFAPCFMSGVLAYHLLTFGRTPKNQLPAWIWPLLIIGWGTAAAVLFGLPTIVPERGWLFCVGVGLFIPLVREMGVNVLTRAAFVVAKYSYGIYLLHQPAHVVAFKWTGSAPLPLQWVLFVALIFVLPFAAYHLVEAPAIRFARGRRTAAPTVGGEIPLETRLTPGV